jgi:hypothetical protein
MLIFSYGLFGRWPQNIHDCRQASLSGSQKTACLQQLKRHRQWIPLTLSKKFHELFEPVDQHDVRGVA